MNKGTRADSRKGCKKEYYKRDYQQLHNRISDTLEFTNMQFRILVNEGYRKGCLCPSLYKSLVFSIRTLKRYK